MKVSIENLYKTFTLHHQNATKIEVLKNISLTINQGECVVLTGNSGSGKSTLLRTLYGNYLPDQGKIILQDQDIQLDIVQATARQMIYLRKNKIGWVSQFLRSIPRVSSLDLVMAPALKLGIDPMLAKEKASELLTRLNIPKHLWTLAPATFSGGEQQRVNIARGFMVDYPCLLLDEPTASLDAKNRNEVLTLINEAKRRGASIVGIFHDEIAKDAVKDREFNLCAGKEE